jgi:two-component system cell cycle sensor histidine kinase/response regulator CckA
VSAPVFRGEVGEVLRQASAVVGRPVILWEVSGANDLVPRAMGEADPAAPMPRFDLETLRRWKVPIPVGSRWVAALAGPQGPWVIAPVRSQPPAPPPDGRERRSRERLALELTGLALGLIERRTTVELAAGAHRTEPLQELASLPAMIAHEASNPLTAARAGLQLAMESVGRWVDLSADRRLMLLDDLGQVIEDIDRTTDFLRAVQDRARGALARSERFDVVRVVRSCLTLERRLLRDRGIELELSATIESAYLKGDPNAFFDLLVNLIRNAADASTPKQGPVEVRLAQDATQLELVVRDSGSGIDPRDLPQIFEPGFTTKEFGKGSGMGLAKVRSVAEGMFHGTVRAESAPGAGATFTVLLPLPPQRSSDPRRDAVDPP